VDQHRAKLTDLASLLERIISNPTVIADQDFDRKLSEVQSRVEALLADTKKQSGGDKSISDQLEELKSRLQVHNFIKFNHLKMINYFNFNSKFNGWLEKLK